MLVTLLGMVIEVRLLHRLNAVSPMLVTPSGMVTEVRPQLLKVAYSILVTLLGIVMDVRA